MGPQSWIRSAFEIHPAAAEVILSLETAPEKWNSDEHLLFLSEFSPSYRWLSEFGFHSWMSPLKIWIANGPGFLRVQGDRDLERAGRWNARTRRKVWVVFKAWKRAKSSVPAQQREAEAIRAITRPPFHRDADDSGKVIPFR